MKYVKLLCATYLKMPILHTSNEYYMYQKRFVKIWRNFKLLLTSWTFSRRSDLKLMFFCFWQSRAQNFQGFYSYYPWKFWCSHFELNCVLLLSLAGIGHISMLCRSQALLWYRHGGKEVVEDTKAMAGNSGSHSPSLSSFIFPSVIEGSAPHQPFVCRKVTKYVSQ